MATVLYLAHYRCTAHKFEALMLEDQDGGYCRRLTSPKCCGSWNRRLRRWKINPKELIEELADFVEEPQP